MNFDVGSMPHLLLPLTVSACTVTSILHPHQWTLWSKPCNLQSSDHDARIYDRSLRHRSPLAASRQRTPHHRYCQSRANAHLSPHSRLRLRAQGQVGATCPLLTLLLIFTSDTRGSSPRTASAPVRVATSASLQAKPTRDTWFPECLRARLKPQPLLLVKYRDLHPPKARDRIA